jgi:hypothetical protein
MVGEMAVVEMEAAMVGERGVEGRAVATAVEVEVAGRVGGERAVEMVVVGGGGGRGRWRWWR